jgi:hypothetical protein
MPQDGWKVGRADHFKIAAEAKLKEIEGWIFHHISKMAI